MTSQLNIHCTMMMQQLINWIVVVRANNSWPLRGDGAILYILMAQYLG